MTHSKSSRASPVTIDLLDNKLTLPLVKGVLLVLMSHRFQTYVCSGLGSPKRAQDSLRCCSELLLSSTRNFSCRAATAHRLRRRKRCPIASINTTEISFNSKVTRRRRLHAHCGRDCGGEGAEAVPRFPPPAEGTRQFTPRKKEQIKERGLPC